MRLKKLIIKNFRNYSGETIFDLSKDITILYGENGNGKSSFFDAVEWCVTGEIKRFAPINKNKEIISNSSLRNGEECMVSLYFKEFILKRSFTKVDTNSFNNIKVSIENCTTNEVLQGESNVIKKIEEIVSKDSMFKWDKKTMSQAYILSQSQINSFITKDSSKDRYDSLASIMGFEKVNNLKKNIEKSKNEIKNQIAFNDLEIKKIDEKEELLQKKFNDKLEKYELNLNDIELYSNVKSTAQELSEIKSLISKFLIDKEELLKKNYKYTSNPEKLKEFIFKKEKEIEKNTKELEEKILEETCELAELQKLKKEYNQLNEEIELSKNKQSKIEKLKKLSENVLIILEKNKVAEIDLVSFELQKCVSEKKKLDYRIEKSKEFFNSKSGTLKVTNEIKELIEKRKILELEIKELDDNYNVLQKDFSSGEVSSDIQNLLSLVEHASNFTKDNSEYTNACPVCDSEVEKLEEQLNLKVKKLIYESGKYQEKIRKNISKREDLSEKIDGLKKEKENIVKKIISLETQKNNYDSISKEIINNVLFDDNLFNNSNVKIELFISEIETTIKELENVLQIQKEIEELKLELSLPLKSSMLEKNLSPDELKKELEKKVYKINNKKIEIKTQKNIIGQLKMEVESLSDNKDLLNKLYEKYQISTDIELTTYLNKKLEESILKEKSLENSLKKSNEMNELKNINEEKDLLIKKKKEFKIIKKYYKDIEKKLCIKENTITEKFGNKTVEFLNNPNSSIVKYYQYLNPNPVEFQELFFDVTNDRELDIKVKSENNSTIANYMLSSGQLNVLAISIFIATNTSQTFSFFDFIAIDDPVQNMDDVNRFSITDVLSGLKRQLIFSTHDIEYLNLFVKKNDYRLKDISVYNLDSDNNNYKNILISEIATQKF
ncbi:AAA family ATPase [Enterococcus hirae]|uniref:AAA family ATPase n=1 Tax=Enterococcus hirae TaxID=1354 RepID=UPI003FD1D46F